MTAIKTVSRKCIAWDVDDTLCHFMEPCLQELNRVMGIRLHPHQLVNSMWLNDFLTKEQFEAFKPYVFNASFYSELRRTAILDQRRTPEFSALHEELDFHVVTARRYALGRRALSITANWLEEHAVEVMDGISICHPDQPKIEVFPANTVAVVDDSASVCLQASKAGLWAFLIDKPWNRHVTEELHPKLIRCTHENVLQHLKRVLIA